MEEQFYTPQVASTLISKLRYSFFMREEKKMDESITVYFTNGKEIEYLCSGVGKVLFEQFSQAQSLGKFWHKSVKDAYEYKVIRHAR